MTEVSTAKPIIGLISLYVIENNGVRFLASSLRKNGCKAVEIYLKDYKHHNFSLPSQKEIDLLIKTLEDEKVTFVGISLRAGAYLRFAADLTTIIKRRLNIPVIWGGMHVTMSPEECLPYPDYLGIGECENVIADIASHLEKGQSLETIPNLWGKDSQGNIFRNPLRPLEQDLDSIELRDFHTDSDKYWINENKVTKGDPYSKETIYLFMTSRGCPFNCSYCEVSALRKVYDKLGPFYRSMTPEKVILECHYAIKTFPNLKRFRFDDELFCIDPKWVEKFAELYKKEINLPFELLTDPRVVTKETFSVLKNAGLSSVMMGIQHTNKVNAALYNRKVTDEQVIKASKILRDLKLNPCYQILLDDPHLQSQDKKDLLDLLCRLARPYDLYLFSLSYWPQTDTTERYLSEGTICPQDVEGLNDKCLKQFRVDLAWPRSDEDVFWLSLYTLLSKPLITVSMIKWLSKQKWLMKNPQPLYWLAQLLNFTKLGYLAISMLFRGELTITTVKRWVNTKSLVTA